MIVSEGCLSSMNAFLNDSLVEMSAQALTCGFGTPFAPFRLVWWTYTTHVASCLTLMKSLFPSAHS